MFRSPAPIASHVLLRAASTTFIIALLAIAAFAPTHVLATEEPPCAIPREMYDLSTGTDANRNPRPVGTTDDWIVVDAPYSLTPHAATVVVRNPAWADLAPATWISDRVDSRGEPAYSPVGWYTYERTFTVNTMVQSTQLEFLFAADNGVIVSLDGDELGRYIGAHNADHSPFNQAHGFNALVRLTPGTHTLTAEVYNYGGPQGLAIWAALGGCPVEATCDAVPIKVIERDLTTLVGDQTIDLAPSHAAHDGTARTPVPPTLFQTPVPNDEHTTSTMRNDGGTFFGVNIKAKTIGSACAVATSYTADQGQAEALAVAYLEDLSITYLGTEILSLDVARMETHAWGDTEHTEGHSRCTPVGYSSALLATIGTPCTVSNLKAGGGTLEIIFNERWGPENSHRGWTYGAALVHVALKTATTHLDIYLGYNEVTVTGGAPDDRDEPCTLSGSSLSDGIACDLGQVLGPRT